MQFVIVSSIIVVSLVFSEDDSKELSEDEKLIIKKLEQKGYRKVILGKKVPSSDETIVKEFKSLDPMGSLIYGTVLLMQNEIRVYPR